MSLPASALDFWQRLGEPPPDALVDARLQLHWAAQIPASVGYTYLDPVPDWSHVSLSWHADGCVLASGPTPGDAPCRAALRPADLTLLLLDAHNVAVAAFPLDGRTLNEGYSWLATVLAEHSGGALNEPLVRPDHEMPPHPVGDGGAFSRTPAPAFAEMARWFADAHLLLEAVRAVEPAASPVRCWPHHFDLAVLLTLDPDAAPEKARSIGVGMEPGDGSYAEPYWYVTPWPYPEHPTLPPLDGGGHWHTEGWTGAVLTARALVGEGRAAAQTRRVSDFVTSALAAAHRLVGAQTHEP